MKREISVEIPAEEVARETEAIVQKYQKVARLPGFRAGHVPASIIRQRFKEDLKSDVVEALVPRYFRIEAEKQGMVPVSQPRVSDLHIHEGEPLRFKASFEIMPEIKVEGYKELRADHPEIAVKDEEVDEALAMCASSMPPTPRSRAALWRTAISRRPHGRQAKRDEDGSAKPVHMAEVLIEIGGKNTVPEFSEHLRGAAADEERTFEVDISRRHQRQAPGGKDVRLHREGAGHQTEDSAGTD